MMNSINGNTINTWGKYTIYILISDHLFNNPQHSEQIFTLSQWFLKLNLLPNHSLGVKLKWTTSF